MVLQSPFCRSENRHVPRYADCYFEDILEDMPFEEGRAYNQRLMPIVRNTVKPDGM
jgi:hypothetical protein